MKTLKDIYNERVEDINNNTEKEFNIIIPKAGLARGIRIISGTTSMRSIEKVVLFHNRQTTLALLENMIERLEEGKHINENSSQIDMEQDIAWNDLINYIKEQINLIKL